MQTDYELILFDWNGTLSTAGMPTFDQMISPLFSGVPEMLKQLDDAGIFLAIVTMASREDMQLQLEALGIAQHFIALSCGDDGFVKPHPSAIESVLNQTGVSASKALMVGDTLSDMNCARYANVKAVKIGTPILEGDNLDETVVAVLPVVTELLCYLA